MPKETALHPPGTVSTSRAAFSGMCAILVGVGLGRFAYSPLITPLITEHWFTPSQAAYLGAANLVGYLVGALCGRWMTRAAPAARVLRATMGLGTATFFACAFPLSFLWFFAWRFAAGLAGGALMVLAAPTVLPSVPQAKRGLAGGVIFTGVGLGIAASGTLVPLLLRWGLAETWYGLGALALGLTALAWGGWPNPRAGEIASPAARQHPPLPTRTLRALYVEYGLNAVGLVPHMVFLVDFIARALDRGLATGAHYWVLFGAGAMAGPVLAGHLGDRIGFRPALRWAFVAQALAVVLPAITTHPVWLAASSVVVGAFVPGIVPLVLGRVHELIPQGGDDQKASWSTATTAFAVGQATAAYGFSFLFDYSGSHMPLFQLGAVAFVLALAIDVLAALEAHTPASPGRRSRRSRPH
jgi:predicted MFS family arabinose efflux permease